MKWKGIRTDILNALAVGLFTLLARKSKGKKQEPPPAPTVIRAKPQKK